MNNDKCAWLISSLEILPLLAYPFDLSVLPDCGIYFFYEKGEICPAHNDKLRIVRVGTANQGNFRKRISEHFLIDERRMIFDKNNPKPSDRSIFRKNIGRVLVNKSNANYLRIWNIDFIKVHNRIMYGEERDINFECKIEQKITKILRNYFSFRFLFFDNENIDDDQYALEKHLIGTVSRCPKCKPSKNWLGNSSPEPKIRESGLWQTQHIYGEMISDSDMDQIVKLIERTLKKFYLK